MISPIVYIRSRVLPVYFSRGQKYYKDHAAHVDTVETHANGMTVLAGTVIGSEEYQTSIIVQPRDTGGLPDIDYECDCPVDGPCKHCVAFAYQVDYEYQITDQGQVIPRDKKDTPVPSSVMSAHFSEEAFLASVPPEIRAMIENTRVYPKSEPQSRFALLGSKNQQTNNTIYKVKLELTTYRGQSELHLGLYECQPLKNGKYGKGKEILQSSQYRIPDRYSGTRPFLSPGSSYYGQSQPRLSFADAPQAFFDILSRESLLLDKDEYTSFRLSPDTSILVLVREENKQGEGILVPKLKNESGQYSSLDKKYTFFSKQELHMILMSGGVLQSFISDLPPDFLRSILEQPIVLTESEKQLLKKTPEYLQKILPSIDSISDIGIEAREDIAPKLSLQVCIPDTLAEVSVRIGFRYENDRIWGEDSTEYIMTDEIWIRRDFEQEKSLIQYLVPILIGGHFSAADTFVRIVGEGIDEFFGGLDNLRSQDICEIEYMQEIEKVSAKPAKVKLSVSSGIDWFDAAVTFSVDEMSADIGERLLSAVRDKRRYIILDDGTALLVRSELQDAVKQLDSLGIDPLNEGPQKLKRYMIGGLDSEKGAPITFALDERVTALKASLANFKKLPNTKIPTQLKATLRKYQETGFRWIHFLESEGFSGILADDMGLGKTIQTITFLIDFLARGTTKGPILIICPTSLVFNWQDEFTRFAPHIRVMSVTHGKVDLVSIDAVQVIITSYGVIQRFVDIFTAIAWSGLIMDEAQNIKNANSVRAKNIRMLSAGFRLALSGTPIENHLLELKSLFDILMPGFLGSDADFKRRYMTGDTIELGNLSRKVKPFILRRTKEIVAKDLPPKIEEIVYLDMEEDQKKYYDSIKSAYQKKILTQVESEGFEKSQFAILEALMRMRQATLTPSLIDPKRKESSVKLSYLAENLPEIIESGHSVLIFSQFPSFLSHVRTLLDEKNIKYNYLDGKTKDRQSLVQEFNTGKIPVFLISLKAGGTGLNLVSADYVIHLDPWWNPAVEAQATDRAHRIGQKRTVFVQKLIVRGTIEEKVLELQKKKKKIVEDVFSGDWSGKLKKEDLKYIFS